MTHVAVQPHVVGMHAGSSRALVFEVENSCGIFIVGIPVRNTRNWRTAD